MVDSAGKRHELMPVDRSLEKRKVGNDFRMFVTGTDISCSQDDYDKHKTAKKLKEV